MKKRELEAIIERQAAEIADLRRRVEALEVRPPITIAPEPSVPAPNPYEPREPWKTVPGTPGPMPWWEWNKVWCEVPCGSGSITVTNAKRGEITWVPTAPVDPDAPVYALYWEPTAAE